MAKRCALKDITHVKIVNTRGRRGLRGGPRHCVVVKVNPKRAVIRTKGGGKLVDGGRRMFGCFTTHNKAVARVRKIEGKKGVC